MKRLLEWEEFEDEEDEDTFQIGDKVIKNEKTWIPSDFDNWGRGEGIGVIIKPPFELDEGEVDVMWNGGRCFEYTRELKKIK